MEDVWWNWSDKDVNDMLFTITTDPASALSGIVEKGNIHTTEPVPEPATMLLFGAGLSGLAIFKRKKELRKPEHATP